MIATSGHFQYSLLGAAHFHLVGQSDKYSNSFPTESDAMQMKRLLLRGGAFTVRKCKNSKTRARAHGASCEAAKHPTAPKSRQLIEVWVAGDFSFGTLCCAPPGR